MHFKHIDTDEMKVKSLVNVLGINLISTDDEDECVATMPVDENTRQPFGYLSGGASLALAETVAGAGTLELCPGKIAVGLNVSGTHANPVAEGHTVTARGRLIKRGNHVHVWEVKVTDDEGNLVSTVTVTNYIIRPKD